MRKDRPGEIPMPMPNPEIIAPQGYVYLAWQGDRFAHLSPDHDHTLCGAVNETPSDPIVSADPLGKPRCPTCLTAAGIVQVDGEPVPAPVAGESDPEPSKTPSNPGPQPPQLKMPPPEFFRRFRK